MRAASCTTPIICVTWNAHARNFCVRWNSNSARCISKVPVIVVSSIEMKFVRPAVLDDALTVKTRIKLLRRASVIFEQTIVRGEETICTAQVRCASVDMKLGVPTQADPRILAALKPYAPDDSI